MSSPQNDISALFNIMSPAGEIVLARTDGRHIGYDASNAAKLRECGVLEGFTDDEFDDVAATLSGYGYGICVVNYDEED